MDSVLARELNNGKIYVIEMSRFQKSPFSGYGGYVGKRLFCFGCDEDRYGEYISRKIKLEGIDKNYNENICEGCAKILEIIRPFLVPVLQVASHEGRVWWRIPRNIYEKYSDMLFSFRDYNFPHECDEDEYTVILGATDSGYGDPISLDTLLDYLAMIRSHFYYQDNLLITYNDRVYNLNEIKNIINKSNIVSRIDLSDELDKVLSARSNDEKKKTLENFAELILSSIKDFEIKYQNKRTSDSELDMMIINETKDTFLKELGNPILVECKNWESKIPSKEVKAYSTNLRLNNIHTGILFTLRGITGDSYKDAKGFLRQIRTKDDIKILIFDCDDYERIVKGENLKSMLKEKYYETFIY